MSSAEKKWVIIFSLVVLIITTLPYLAGFWTQGSAYRFTGFFMGVEDGNSYIAKMLSGSAGEWLFKTPYTAYPQSGFLAFFPYLLMGKLVSGIDQHEQLVALFQVFRWLGGILMVFATYHFVAHFSDDPRLRKLGTAIGILGGGFGWLAFVGLQSLWGNRIPLEVYSPETFGFLSLFSLPHLSMGRGLLLLGISAYWRGYSATQTVRDHLKNGLIWLLLGFMQPMTVLIGWMVIGIDFSIRLFKKVIKKQEINGWSNGLRNAIWMVALSAPMVVYTALSFLSDPILKVWSAQNIIMSPPVSDYSLAFGITFPFLYSGIKSILKKSQVEGWALLIWLILFPLLAYFPYNLQRRLPEGIWVALVVVTILGLEQIHGRKRKVAQIWLYSSFLVTFILFLGSFLSVFQLKAPVFRTTDEVGAFEYLRQSTQGFPIVLTSYDTANALPAWAPVRTLIGHGPESIHLKEIQPQVESVFSSTTSDLDREKVFREFNVRYVFWGPVERSLGEWNPASMPGLRSVYQNTTVQIFEVTR